MVDLRQVSKRFRTRKGEIQALAEIDLKVGAGEFVVVRGPSGSGKSTLLLTAGGMLRPSSGQVTVDGADLYALGGRGRASFRARNIGFVFQMFHLVPYLTALQNVILAAGGQRGPAVHARARELLSSLGLSEREHSLPSQLSAGERQRAAVARALLNGPRIVLADEPTGNLDPDSAAAVFEGLAAFHRGGGTVIVVTHGTGADRHANRIVWLRAGRIEAEKDPMIPPFEDILNGSFVTDIIEPNDVDCVLLIGKGFPRDAVAADELRDGLPFLEISIVPQKAFRRLVNVFFASDRYGEPKGMVEIAL